MVASKGRSTGWSIDWIHCAAQQLLQVQSEVLMVQALKLPSMYPPQSTLLDDANSHAAAHQQLV
jgi:hypothetical protein